MRNTNDERKRLEDAFDACSRDTMDYTISNIYSEKGGEAFYRRALICAELANIYLQDDSVEDAVTYLERAVADIRNSETICNKISKHPVFIKKCKSLKSELYARIDNVRSSNHDYNNQNAAQNICPVNKVKRNSLFASILPEKDDNQPNQNLDGTNIFSNSKAK